MALQDQSEANKKFSQSHLFARPLESSDHGVFNFIEILYSLGAVDQDVGTGDVRTKAPDFPHFACIKPVLFCQIPSSNFWISVG